MENKPVQKGNGPSKSFLTVGPTLHYSHTNVRLCWALALLVYAVACLIWTRIHTGFWTPGIENLADRSLWGLGPYVNGPVSIFEYPWQILVLGLLMGILAAVPVLTSQLMSFHYSIIFILAVFFLANLPVFALCLLISCFAAACRPLRFRSRFIAIALCTTPQLFYWGYFGGARGVEPIEWGFSYAPWICAWLDALTIAGLVLGIGHFTRYRPGLIWIFTTLTLVIAMVVFEVGIGFDELDYQLYVAKNNPEHAGEFHDHSITEILDQAMTDPATQKYLDESFYPADPIARRAEIKKDIQEQLNDGWPDWLGVPPEVEYKERKEELLRQYDFFINHRPGSRRMPVVLYYKAILNEYSPDMPVFGQKEVLRFYSDYPQEKASRIWWGLYQSFPVSPESVEARWRIAMQWAGRGLFEQAEDLLAKTQTMLAAERTKLLAEEQAPAGKLFGLFHPPAESVMTPPKLSDLERRINLLRTLLGPENRSDEPASKDRLAKFVMLNPHAPDYAQHLDGLLEQTEEADRLRDNILLAQAKLIADEQLRAEKLSELHKEYSKTDTGMLALYDLGLLKINLWRQQDESDAALKKKYLDEARTALSSFMSLYPENFYIEQVKKNLDGLPAN